MTSITACIYRPIPNSEDEVEIEVTVHGSCVPYIPAKTYGPPEDCYPAEGGYADDVQAYILLPSVGKKSRRTYIPLTSEEVEEFSQELMLRAEEDERDAYEYECEARAEARMKCFDD